MKSTYLQFYPLFYRQLRRRSMPLYPFTRVVITNADVDLINSRAGIKMRKKAGVSDAKEIVFIKVVDSQKLFVSTCL